MHVVDPPRMPARSLQHIGAGVSQVPGVDEQTDRGPGVFHQQVDLPLGLHDCTHVVVVGHTDAALRHVFRQRGQFPAVELELLGGQPRPTRQRRVDARLNAAGGLRVDQNLRS